MLGLAVILDLGVIARMPEDPRHHRPFRHPHLQQRDARGRQRRFREQGIGLQLGMRRQRAGALMGARPARGEDMVKFLHQIGQLLGRQAVRVQARRFIGVDIVAELVMAGAGTQRQCRPAVAHQDDARTLRE